jgi:hypothetical protein
MNTRPSGRLAPIPKAGQTVQPVTPGADIAAMPGRAAQAFGDVTGISDAARALRGEMTPEEAQEFALTAAAGVVAPELRGARAAMTAAEKVAPEVVN